MLAAIVDWAALGKVIVYSFAATLVLTLLFTTGVLRIGGGEGERGGVAARAIGVAAFAGCVGLVLIGLYVMFAFK
jgi:hypothetical protein